MNNYKEDPIVAVQVVIVRRGEDSNETVQSFDIPVRNQRNADFHLTSSEYGVTLELSVKNDPNYSIAYLMRTHEAADHEGKLHPYCDGIRSEADVDKIKNGYEVNLDILKVENQKLKRELESRKQKSLKLKNENKKLKGLLLSNSY